MLPLVLAVLGVLGLIAGWLPGLKSVLGDDIGLSTSEKVFFTQGYLPILVLFVGLLAVAPRLPGGKAYPLPNALLAVAGLLGAIGALTAGTPEGAKAGFGLILLLIVTVLQAATAGYAWFLSTGAVKPAKAPSTSAPSTSAPSAPAPAPAFGPGPSSAPASPAAPPAPTGFGGYAAGAYTPAAAPGQTPDAPAYTGYGSGSYSAPAAPPNSGYTPYTPASSEPSYNTGSTPAANPYGSGDGASGSGAPTQAGPATGQQGRDDGPPPDVTQQVRF